MSDDWPADDAAITIAKAAKRLPIDHTDDDKTVRVEVAGVGRGRSVMFAFRRGGEPLGGMVVLDANAALQVYVNRCPHVPYSLDLGDGNVLDHDGLTVVCSNHGARFDPGSGRCIWGPARGGALERLPFRVEGTAIVVTITPEPQDWREIADPQA